MMSLWHTIKALLINTLLESGNLHEYSPRFFELQFYLLRKLQEIFGECSRPRAGWQIGPHGHSKEMTSIYARFGYDGHFIRHISEEQRKSLITSNELEFVWHSSNSLGSKSEIFTSVLYNLEDSIPGFCFDILCSDDPIVDDTTSPEFNLKSKVMNSLNCLMLPCCNIISFTLHRLMSLFVTLKNRPESIVPTI